jgi:hypothetical protein
MSFEKQTINKARKYLIAKGYSSRDFFSAITKEPNNVRQSRTQIEKGQDHSNAKPQVRPVVGHPDAGQDGGGR